MVMLTLTARHGREDALGALLTAMKGSKRRLHRSKPWQRLKACLVGHVTATELTDGSNGWHPHFHVILLVRAPSQAEALRMVEELHAPWMTAPSTDGLDGNGAAFQAQGAAEAGRYIGKWGAAEELALAGSKRGRTGGRTPWQLLADATHQGDRRAAARWQEYARALKGRHQLEWSRGLKAMAGIDERTDAELAAAEASQRDVLPVARIPANRWRAIMRENRRRRCEAADIRAELVSTAEAALAEGDVRAVQAAVDGLIPRILAPPGTGV